LIPPNQNPADVLERRRSPLWGRKGGRGQMTDDVLYSVIVHCSLSHLLMKLCQRASALDCAVSALDFTASGKYGECSILGVHRPRAGRKCGLFPRVTRGVVCVFCLLGTCSCNYSSMLGTRLNCAEWESDLTNLLVAIYG